MAQAPWAVQQKLSPDVHHAARRLLKPRLADMVPRFFLRDDRVDVRDEFRVRIAGAHPPSQIVIENGEETGADFAVGGDPDPAAVAAERA